MPSRGYAEAERLFDLTGQPCADCGGPAQERHHADGDPTHNDPENVALLCRGCHRKRDERYRNFAVSYARDRALGACARGHAFTPENTYWHTSGGYTVRRCRACNALKQREYRARKT